MAKLSEQAADLSVRAKHAQDTIAPAQKEAHERAMARGDKAHADATPAIQKVDKSIKPAVSDVRSAADASAKKWTALQTKVAEDLESLKSDVAQKKHDWDARCTESQADRLELGASLAIHCAIAAVEQAEVAVLDAVAGRMKATDARNA
jgi:hypothetical protein